MTTQPEQLNAAYGPLFATRVDGFGLPIDGWAVPVWKSYDEPDERRSLLEVGTFRIEHTDPPDPHRKSILTVFEHQFVSTKAIADCPLGWTPFQNELLRTLIKRLKLIS